MRIKEMDTWCSTQFVFLSQIDYNWKNFTCTQSMVAKWAVCTTRPDNGGNRFILMLVPYCRATQHHHNPGDNNHHKNYV